MNLRTSAAWWTLFASLPSYLILVYPPAGVVALGGMAVLTARCP